MSSNTNFIAFEPIVVKGKINSFLKSNFKDFNFGGDNIVNTSYVVYYIMKITQLPFFAPKKLPIRVSVIYKDGDTHLNITYFDNDYAKKIKAVLDEKKQSIVEFFSQPQNMGIYFIVDHIVDSLKIKNEIFNEIDNETNTSRINNDYKVEWEYENSEKKTQFIIFPHNDNITDFLSSETKEKLAKILSRREYALHRESNATITFSIPKEQNGETIFLDYVKTNIYPLIKEHFKMTRIFDSHNDVFMIKIFDKQIFTRKELEQFENTIFRQTSIRVYGAINNQRFIEEESEEIIACHAGSATDSATIQNDIFVRQPLSISVSPNKLFSDVVRASPMLSKSPVSHSTNWADQAIENEEELREEMEKEQYSKEVSSYSPSPEPIQIETDFANQEISQKEENVVIQVEESNRIEISEPVIKPIVSVQVQETSEKKFVEMTAEEVSEKIGKLGENFKPYKGVFIANALDGEYLSCIEKEELRKDLISFGIRDAHASRICHGIGKWLAN